MNEIKTSLKLLYGGNALFWFMLAYTIACNANRFTYGEVIGISIGSMIAGLGLAMAIHGIISEMKNN